LVTKAAEVLLNCFALLVGIEDVLHTGFWRNVTLNDNDVWLEAQPGDLSVVHTIALIVAAYSNVVSSEPKVVKCAGTVLVVVFCSIQQASRATLETRNSSIRPSKYRSPFRCPTRNCPSLSCIPPEYDWVDESWTAFL